MLTRIHRLLPTLVLAHSGLGTEAGWRTTMTTQVPYGTWPAPAGIGVAYHHRERARAPQPKVIVILTGSPTTHNGFPAPPGIRPKRGATPESRAGEDTRLRPSNRGSTNAGTLTPSSKADYRTHRLHRSGTRFIRGETRTVPGGAVRMADLWHRPIKELVQLGGGGTEGAL